MIRFQWTKQKRPKRAGRHGGYTRMTFGIIDDVTDARAKEAGGRSEIRINTFASLCEQQVFPIKNLNKFNFYRQILVYSKFL